MTIEEILETLDAAPSTSAYAAAARQLKQAAADLPEFRLALLGNHTLDIGAPLAVECARRGLRLELYVSGFDQYRQELLGPSSPMAAFAPDAACLSLDVLSTFPGWVGGDADVSSWVDGLEALLSSFRSRSPVPILLATFVPPPLSALGLAPGPEGSTLERVSWLNRELRRLAGRLSATGIVDLAEVAARDGLDGWRDERLWLLARAGIAPKKFGLVAARIARHLLALRRPPAKCLVLDLDNTVWGGIVGEAGAGGIHCTGESYPGNAYAAFQRTAIALRARGILLAVASKNDRAAVDEAFALREMPLRPEHITEWEVHWEPKSISLQRIAARLNLGVDSLVFLDDNPAEVEQVRQALPAVRAYRMPSRAEEYAAFLASLEDFDQNSVSGDDLRRAEMYEVRRKGQAAVETAADMESFLRSLETCVTVEPAGDANFDRIVQLIQKTNQFNLTTRRHDAQALRAAIDAGGELWAFRASDIHGDHGLIAVALLEFSGETARIDTFLMSCRVIGRTIETAALHHLHQRAAERGARTIEGEWVETAKSGPCKNFYPNHGYTSRTANAEGAHWTREAVPPVPLPEWITLRLAGRKD